MARQAEIGMLAAAFRDAGAAHDWERLGALAKALAPRLSALAARGPWTAAELAALARLRAAHDGAAAACAETLENLAQRLSEMRDNKDGWMAYALASETESA